MKLTWTLAIPVLCLDLAFRPGVVAQEPTLLSLSDVPIPVPMAAVIPVAPNAPADSNPIPGPEKDLPFAPLSASIVKDKAALIRLGKALFWDMQVGSDGIQACATCHFNAGADTRSRNQLSPGLNDTKFDPGNPFHSAGFTGDNIFGDSTVPFTANDPNTPTPPGPSRPPPANLSVPGFPQFKPNYQLTASDFPLNGWLRPTERTPRGPGVSFIEEFANVSRDTNDVISSQGVRRTLFKSVTPGIAVEEGDPTTDIFNVAKPGALDKDSRVRRPEARNAPSVINAVFNFDNFWEGRASFIFNGINPFGFRDRHSTLRLNDNGTLQNVFVRFTNSSLASQAVGPPLSNFEMSWENRTFPDLGKKVVSLKPLAQQLVHPQDSVLGAVSKAMLDDEGNATGDSGLTVGTYTDMIKDAFQDQWWNSDQIVEPVAATIAKMEPSTNNPRAIIFSMGRGQSRSLPRAALASLGANQYTQMQWNFSMFFGLAIQAYEATLVSDDTPFDRFQKGDHDALTASQRNGLAIFMDEDPNNGGRCNNCHRVPITTNHNIPDIQPDQQGRPTDIVEFMVMGDGASANYDKGFYNIGVRRTTEDVGRAGTAPSDKAPFRNPRDGDKPFPLSYVALAGLATHCKVPEDPQNPDPECKLPPDVLRFVQLDPNTKQPIPVLDRQAINGNFKAPNLRNAKFTGPYFHNGDSATLRHVVEFYTRGGNFPNTNLHDLDPDVNGIPRLMFPEFLPSARQNIIDLVSFVADGLTDERVAMERAPFDHPQLMVPNGSPTGKPGEDDIMKIPAVGQNGRTAPIATFLELNPQAR